jgi:hypothetical protein
VQGRQDRRGDKGEEKQVEQDRIPPPDVRPRYLIGTSYQAGSGFAHAARLLLADGLLLAIKHWLFGVLNDRGI